MSLTKTELPFEMYYVMTAFVIYYAVIHALFSIVSETEQIDYKKDDDKNNNGSKKPSGFLKNVLLVFHILSIMGFVIVGVIMISRGSSLVDD